MTRIDKIIEQTKKTFKEDIISNTRYGKTLLKKALIFKSKYGDKCTVGVGWTVKFSIQNYKGGTSGDPYTVLLTATLRGDEYTCQLNFDNQDEFRREIRNYTNIQP
jgi:hypothetical protein